MEKPEAAGLLEATESAGTRTGGENSQWRNDDAKNGNSLRIFG